MFNIDEDPENADWIKYTEKATLRRRAAAAEAAKAKAKALEDEYAAAAAEASKIFEDT